jgi:hypothetical protein
MIVIFERHVNRMQSRGRANLLKQHAFLISCPVQQALVSVSENILAFGLTQQSLEASLSGTFLVMKNWPRYLKQGFVIAFGKCLVN